jgi:hypothetical protein
MRPNHKSLAPAAAVAAVVALVAAVAAEIAAVAVASKLPHRVNRYERGASSEAPLHVIPHPSYLRFNSS